MLERFKDLVKGSKDNIQRLPFHIALTIHGGPVWAESHKKTLPETYKKIFSIIEELIGCQIKNKIRIVTFYVLPEKKEASGIFEPVIDNLAEFFNKLATSEMINKNQVKISVLGKWYDLPSRAIDPIKKIIDETKDYDNFFLNFCINYNGQEELLDACKLIARKVQAGKLDPELITKDILKENIYSSYFLSPDIIIKNGYGKSLNAFMLWDSSHSKIHFTNKLFPDFTVKDLLESIEEWKKE